MAPSRAKEHWQHVVTAVPDLDSLSYYQLLGVEPDAQEDSISEFYYHLVRVAHPDRHARERDPQRKRAIVLLYARIGEAHRVLTTPALRKSYDESLAAGSTRLAQEAPKPTLVETRDPRSPKARELYQQGMQLLRAGDTPRARAQLDLALQFEPDSKVIRDAVEEVTPQHLKKPEASAPPTQPSSARGEGSEGQAQTSEDQAPPAPRGEGSDERRHHPRRRMAHPVRVRCSNWDEARTLYTMNLSRGGMFLRSANPLEVGTPVEIAISLPDDSSFRLRARVARVAAGGSDRAPGMALRFESVDDDERVRLEALLQTAPGAGGDTGAQDDLVLRQLLNELARLRKASASAALKVPPDAEPDLVRKAYLQLAKRTHPDLFRRFGGEQIQDAASEVFFLIRQAYERMHNAAQDDSEDAPAPRDREAAISRARTAWLTRDYAEARRCLRHAVDSTPKDRYLRAAYHVAAGHEAKQAERGEEARKHFETALVFDNACAEALRELSGTSVPGEPGADMFTRIFRGEEPA